MEIPVYAPAMRYRDEGMPLIIVADAKVNYYRNGGVLPTVLRSLLRST
jgi:hypothetical protein